MQDIKIAASSFVVPEQIVTNDDLAEFMDTSDEWISKRTGIKRRHISQLENTSDLATKVASNLLKQGDLQPKELDLIVVATMSGDNLSPSTAAMVQGKLAATKAVAFDISAACSGFSYAMSIARSLMLVNDYQNALVIGAEVLSKVLDWNDRSTAVLFGDGSGGVLLKRSSQLHFLSQDLRTFGQLGDKLVAGHLEKNTDYRVNSHKLTAFQMDGREVYRFATKEVPKSIMRSLQQANISLEQVDYFLLHQANSRIIEHVAKRLGQPISKFPMNIAEYGNTAAASEAILLAECLKKGIVKKNSIIALSGFGGGLSLATIIFKI